ncbi:MAG: quinone oxidoreductase [Halieaceae bacterium]|nr:quinone oxidoreductase [Halieaceae bacterium]
MVRAIRIHETGAPQVMQLETVELAPPQPGFVTVRNEAIGLNYIDTYHRSGLYPVPLPSGIGLEAAGIVTAVGEGAEWAEGDRVVYFSVGLGAYSEAQNLPAERLVRVPHDIDLESAAALALKGATAEYLLQRTRPLQAGETCLFHAAAGGVGLIFGQWARAIGARAIGTAGSDDKVELAGRHGYHQVINYRTENVLERVLEITGGEKLPVIYDGVGKDTFELSLDLLRPRGLLVSFGNASGPPGPLDLQVLTAKGSLYITRPSLVTYAADPREMRQAMADVFALTASGELKPNIRQCYALAEVQQAHRDLEARDTTGCSIILP